jgi:hypothetical protein
MEVAAQRPATGLDRPTSLKLARALRSSCDDHHKRALFTADGVRAAASGQAAASYLCVRERDKRLELVTTRLAFPQVLYAMPIQIS